MQKLFILFTLISLLASCSETENDITSSIEPTNEAMLKEFVYAFKGVDYKLIVDYSNEEEPEIIETEDSEKLKTIFSYPNAIFLETEDDLSKTYVFENQDEYKNSSIFKSISKKYKSKSEVSSAQNSSVSFYKRGNLYYNGGGFTVSVPSYIYEIPDFNTISNGNGIVLFPQSWYDAGTKNINDDVSSLSINYSSVVLYEHPNYGGRQSWYDYLYTTREINDLHDEFWLIFGGIFIRSVNDRVSSARLSGSIDLRNIY